MHRYRELKVWQRAMAYCVQIYDVSSCWNSDERFGLISQVRRATYSIPLNIAEGAGNSSDKEFCRFLEIALRSSYEVMTALDIACGLKFIKKDQNEILQKEADEIAAMLVGLIKSKKG